MPLCVDTHRRMTAFAFWKPVTIKVTSTRPLVRGVAQRAAKSAAVICEVGIGGGLGGGGDGDGGRFGKPKGTSGGWFGDGAIGGGRGNGGSDGGMGPRSGSAFAIDIITPKAPPMAARRMTTVQVQQMARRRQRRWRELLGFFGSFGLPTSTADSLTTASSVDGVSSTEGCAIGMSRKASHVRLEVWRNL